MSRPDLHSRSPLRFVITSHAHLPGARLSLLGSWANLPFATDEGAERAAVAHANGRAYSIERRAFPALSPARGGSTCKP
jgi:hypothetical protein